MLYSIAFGSFIKADAADCKGTDLRALETSERSPKVPSVDLPCGQQRCHFERRKARSRTERALYVLVGERIHAENGLLALNSVTFSLDR